MRSTAAIKNGSITFACQILDILLGFISRKLFIDYIGILYLGINGTFTSILQTLSLAELGFESAIVYSLYKPIAENDTEKIENVLSILKRVYQCVGIFIVISGCIISLFLNQILKGVEVNIYIYIAYYLFVLSSLATYFLAYKRTFLFAVQKDYVKNLYVAGYKFLTTLLQVVFIMAFHSFIVYVLISVINNILTNVHIARYVDKHFNLNFNKKIDTVLFWKIWADVKNIFLGKIAGFVYSSTDNIIISICINTVSVGFLGNYTQTLTHLKKLIGNVFNSIKPVVGSFLAEESNKEKSLELLLDYSFIRYVISSVFLIPSFVLFDNLIDIWLGSQYVLPRYISLLIVSDFFIHLVHGALVDYIAGCGLFKQDKIISIIGAIINLAISLILASFWGIGGVLVGTVVSQIYFWFSRSYVVCNEYFYSKNSLVKYWSKIWKYITIFYILCFVCDYTFHLFVLKYNLWTLIIGGSLCTIFVCLLFVVIWGRSREFVYFQNIIRLKRKKNK